MLSQEEIVKEYDDLIVVSGAQQGIELSCKVLCNPGDTIICENPSFIGFPFYLQIEFSYSCLLTSLLFE